MPRQDYSLPSVVALPRLAPPRRPTPADAQPSVQSQPAGEGAATNVETTATAPSNSDDEYDMLDDHCDILKALDITTPAVVEAQSSTSAPVPAGSTAFVDMLLKDAEASETPAVVDPNIVTTENGAPTLASSGDPRLDFFFEVLKGTQAETIQRLVRSSWTYHPLDTLKLIFQLRSIVHGKGERQAFYTCLDFLRSEHPRTLLFNLRHVPDHGYWKDLLNWLVFQVRDDPTDHNLSAQPATSRYISARGRGGRGMRVRGGRGMRGHLPSTRGGLQSAKRGAAADVGKLQQLNKKLKFDGSDDPSEEENKEKDEQGEEEEDVSESDTDRKRQCTIRENEDKDQQRSREARAERLEREQQRLERARTVFRDNVVYRTAHLEVARLFANALVRDKALLQQGKSVSLAAKWCPSLKQFHDNHTLIASTIAQILFPEQLAREDHATYVNRVRGQFRQQYYVPLRKATPVLETMMSSNRWNEILYNRISAIALKNSKGLFVSHDKERFEQYLTSVAKNETTIAARALLPHQLVSEASNYAHNPAYGDDLQQATMEAQWKSYVERMAKSGTMDSAMAMCDVSGSMSGEPMNVAIALSLLLAQLSRPPFNSVVLTFSAQPQIHHIKAESLVDKVRDLRQMEWGMNTDLEAAFRKILELSVQNKVAKEDMVKTLFIFSDMEFDQAVVGAAKSEMFTNYEVVKRQFKAAGYDLPQIVFWNLRGSNRGNKPVNSTQQGVAMISGFSGMLMKLFLDGANLKDLDPVKLMEKAIDSKEFARLKVLD